jgi:hypothetical protein
MRIFYAAAGGQKIVLITLGYGFSKPGDWNTVSSA